jgi:outer membrane immunogenic protein
MKKIILIAAVVAATASVPALAAPFSGPYIGAQVGSDNTSIKVDEVGGPNLIDSIGANGVEGGVFAGYDYPVAANTFVGVEAQFSLSDAKASVYDGAYEGRADYSYGVSARLGQKLSDKTALYGRVGWKSTHLKLSDTGTEIWSRDKSGLLLGAGLESYVTPHMSIRAEYGYTLMGTVYNNDSTAVKVNNQQVSLGAAYHF